MPEASIERRTRPFHRRQRHLPASALELCRHNWTLHKRRAGGEGLDPGELEFITQTLKTQRLRAARIPDAGDLSGKAIVGQLPRLLLTPVVLHQQNAIHMTFEDATERKIGSTHTREQMQERPLRPRLGTQSQPTHLNRKGGHHQARLCKLLQLPLWRRVQAKIRTRRNLFRQRMHTDNQCFKGDRRTSAGKPNRDVEFFHRLCHSSLQTSLGCRRQQRDVLRRT